MIEVYGYRDKEDTKVWVKAHKRDAVNYHEINLRNCQTEEEIVLAFAKVFKGDDRDGLVTGRSLDAFNDVARDYFIDSWRRYDTVVVRGWLHANEINFRSCQVIINILQSTYLESIKWRFEEVFDKNKDETLESIDILDELENGHKIYFFMY